MYIMIIRHFHCFKFFYAEWKPDKKKMPDRQCGCFTCADDILRDVTVFLESRMPLLFIPLTRG